MQTDHLILSVDDDPSITKLIQHKLNKQGFKVDAENDPTAVMRRLKSSNYRLVLLDIDMPKISGLDLLAQIKRYDSSIQVIIVTSYNTLGNLTRAHQNGADFILLKPIKNFDNLMDLIERCVFKQDHWIRMIEAVRKEATHAVSI